MAREILSILPQVVAALPADEVYRHLIQLEPLVGVDWAPPEVVCV